MCRKYAPHGPSATPWVDSVDVPSVTVTASPPELTPRRRELLEAAVHVVADEGLRGLTHRAVDRRAGLPEGTCSAYFRTRQALQVAVTQFVAASMAADVDELAAELVECPGDETRAVAGRRAHAGALRTLAGRARARSGQARAVPGGTPQPGCRRGPVRLAHPPGRGRGRTCCRRRRGSTATRAPRRSWRRSTGCCIAALQKPQRERRAFLSGSLTLVMHALTARAPEE